MSAFATDNFTGTDGTNLSSHTSDSGGTWSYLVAQTFLEIKGNKLIANNSTTGISASAAISHTPPSADYDVEADFTPVLVDGGSIGFAGLWARVSASGGNVDGYLAFHIDSGSPPSWYLYKYVAGTPTLLGSYGETLTAGVPIHCKLSVSGTSISVYTGGTLRIGPVTDSDVSGAHNCGLIINIGDTLGNSGYKIDAFSATSTGGPPSGSAPTLTSVSATPVQANADVATVFKAVAVVGTDLDNPFSGGDAAFTFVGLTGASVVSSTINSAVSASLDVQIAAGSGADTGLLQVQTDGGTDTIAFEIAAPGASTVSLIPLGGSDMAYVPFDTTSYIDEILIRDATTGQGMTGLTNADFTGGAYLSFRRTDEAASRDYTGANVLSITTLGTWASPGTGKIRIKHRANGYYEVQFENAVLAAGVATGDVVGTLTWFGVTDMLQGEQRYTLFSKLGTTAQGGTNFSAFFDNGGSASSATQDDVGTGVGLDAAATRAALGLASANLDTQLSSVVTNAALPLKKNTGSQHVPFYMRDSTDPKLGKTGVPTITKSLDGAASWSSTTGTVTEIGNGAVDFSPSAADCNGTLCRYKAVLSGAVTQVVDVYTHA